MAYIIKDGQTSLATKREEISTEVDPKRLQTACVDANRRVDGWRGCGKQNICFPAILESQPRQGSPSPFEEIDFRTTHL
jgi:hypothetical protein